MRQRSVSLAFELSTILEAIDGVPLLARGLQELPGDRQAVRTLAGALAGLAMITTRLKAVVAAVRGDIDPATLLAAHNEVDGVGGQVDVLLRPWSAQQVIRHAEQAATFAPRRMKLGRR